MNPYSDTKYKMIETITSSAKHRPPLHTDPNIHKPIIFAKHDRKVGIGLNIFSVMFVAYSVLFMDFGQKEHCFSSIRRAVFGKMNSWMTIRPEDELYIASRVEQMKLRIKQVDEAKTIYNS